MGYDSKMSHLHKPCMCTLYNIAIPITYYFTLDIQKLYIPSKEDTIGERIRKLRKVKRLTAKELGIQIGITSSGILGYENNKAYPSRKIILKLYKILGDDLLCDEYSKFIVQDYTAIFEKWRVNNELTKKEAAKQLTITESFYHSLIKGEYELTYSYFNRIKSKLKELELGT